MQHQRETIKKALANLTQEEERVISVRFDLIGNSSKYTHKEIGMMFGKSRYSIRKIEKEAIDKLRENMKLRDLQ